MLTQLWLVEMELVGGLPIFSAARIGYKNP